jgi:hypothetical protein
LKKEADLKLLGCADGAQAKGQAALVACCRVLLDNAPFSCTVHEGKGSGNYFAGTLGVFLIEKTAHGADLVAKPGFAETIDSGAAFCHSDALQRRYCICHLRDLYLSCKFTLLGYLMVVMKGMERMGDERDSLK